MSVAMPAIAVLIVCKTAIAGPPDQNAQWTGHENRTWATEHSMMVCRRHEVALYDPAPAPGTGARGADARGADAQPFNAQRCQRAGIVLGAQWDATHRSSRYRFWRVACPVPIADTRTGEIVAWKLPECPHRDVVVCETDAAI